MSNKIELQNNNIDLQGILTKVNTLPKKENIDNEVSSQESLIEQIQLALEGKASGNKTFAAIGVIYPEGSTCICTNGVKTLAARTASGQCVFAIPEAGTWTVQATDGEGNLAEEIIEIVSEGQVESILLTYNLYLFKEGYGVNSNFTIVLGTQDNASVTKDGIIWSTNNGVGNSFGFNPKIDLTPYSKLCIELTCDTRNGNSTSYGITLGVGVNQITGPAAVHDWVAQTSKIWDTTRSIHSVSITDVDGEYFVKIGGYATTGTAHNIWLEK